MNNPRRIQRHLVKALAAGALLAAAALPMAIATAAGAADSISSIVFTPSGAVTSSFGTGASGTAVLNGAFSGDGSNATLTTNAPGVTFSNVVNNSTTQLTAIAFTSTSATVPGTYNLTYTDDGGTVIDSNAFTVNAAPTVSSISPNTVADVTGGGSVNSVITGVGFITATGPVLPTVTVTNTVTGSTLTNTVTGSTSTTVSVTIDGTNSVGGGTASPGTYSITVTNPDGGNSTAAGIFTVTGDEVTAVSPSALAFSSGASTLTISGGGFESGATATLVGCTGVTAGATTVTSATSLTLAVSNANAATAVRCGVTVTNTAPGNLDSFELANGLGIGEASNTAPVITASSLSAATTPIEPGAAAGTITFTGEGFSNFTTPGVTTYGSPALTDTDAVLETGQCIGGGSGTSITCELNVTSGAHTGVHTASLVNDAASGSIANAFTVAGPSITSAAPAALAVGAPVGTTVVLTGTGFANTSTLVGNVVGGSTGLAGNLAYVSPTTANFIVTTPPSTAGSATLTVQTVNSDGATEVSAPFTLTVDNGPTISSITYATGTTGVGVGATATTVTINGTGFKTGATVGTFVNASGTADADVTAKTTSVNAAGTQIVATIAITAGDTNAIDGYTVTNTDGGSAKAFAVAPAGLAIDAAPTITAVSPVTATPSASNAFTITGTGFQTGAVVTASSDGTCGTATVASATSLAVTCTLGAEGSAAVTLSVSNPDGGTAVSGTVLPAKTTTPPVTFRVTGAHGVAIAGKTTTMTITGAGFSGQPRITSSAAGTKVGVSHDNGRVLTIRVTTKAGTRAHTYVFTIRNPNGKTGRANYSVRG